MSTTRSTFSHDLGNYIEHCDLSEGQIACAPYSVKHPILNAFTAFTAFSPAPTTRLSRDMADQRSIVGRDRRPFIVLYTPDQTDEGPVRIVLAARFDKRSVDDLDECTKRLIVALGDTPPYPDGSAPRIPVEPFWGSKHSYAIAHAIDLDPLRRATPYYERGTTGFCVNLQELGRLRAMCKRSSAYLKTLTARDHEALVRSYDVHQARLRREAASRNASRGSRTQQFNVRSRPSSLAIVREETGEPTHTTGDATEWTAVKRHKRGSSRQWDASTAPMRSPRRTSFGRPPSRC